MDCAKFVIALAVAGLVTGCGGSPTPEGSNTTPASPTAISPTEPPTSPSASPSASPAKDSAALAAALGHGTPHVWTAETDPNKLLGRPGGYLSAATVVDKRVPCDDPKKPGASCGATVEVFSSAEDAKARSDYIQSILKGGGILGTEYHTLVGPNLLRVTGQLTPAQAAVYAERFKAAAG